MEEQLKEIEKTLSINLDIIDNTLGEINIHLELIAIATKKIALELTKARVGGNK